MPEITALVPSPAPAEGREDRTALDLPQAEIREVKAELLRRAGESVLETPRHPGEVAAAWLVEYRSDHTRAAYASDLARFFIWCQVKTVNIYAARRHHLSSYLAEPRPDGAPFAPKTLERRLAAISGFYSYALDLDLIERHPRGVRKPLSVPTRRAQGAASLSKDELQQLVRTAAEHSPNALLIVYLLGLYGLRVSEVCDLQIAQVTRDEGQAVLQIAGKGRAANETTAFPLPHDVQDAITSVAGDRAEGHLLTKTSGRPYVRQEVAALLRTLTKRAGIATALSPHGLRATFVTLALNEGAALRDVQDAARHADPRTTRLYDRDAGALNRHPVHRLIGLTSE